MKIKDKARTLLNLKIRGAIIPKLKIYKWRNFIKKENNILKDIKKNIAVKIT